MPEHEKEKLKNYKIPNISVEDIRKNGSNPFLEWIEKNSIKYLAVHFDLDVLSSDDFRSLLYNEPNTLEKPYTTGKLTLREVVDIITDVSKK